MKRYQINQYEQVVSQDLNDLQKTIHQSIYDKTLYPFFSKQNGFLGDGFTVSRVNATSVSILAGRGFYYDAAQTGTEPKYRAIQLGSDLTLTVGVGTWAAAPDAPDNRIDIIVVRPLESVVTTADRLVRLNGTGPIEEQTVDKVLEQLYEINVVEGTADPSPSVPATPAGWLKIAEITITGGTGIASSSDVIDTRAILLPAVPSVPSDTRFVAPSGAGTDSTLASAISNLPAEGGSILILEDITLTAVHELPAGCKLRGRGRGTRITIESPGALVVAGDECSIEDLVIEFDEAITALTIEGSFCTVERVSFVGPDDQAFTAISVEGNANHVGECVFYGVLFPSLGTGIDYEAGSTDNSDEFNAFME